MGRYIQGPNTGKAEHIIRTHKAEHLKFPPPDFSHIPEGRALIVVCENGLFDAAAYCYDEVEFKAFVRPDGRYKSYLLIDKALAEQLTKDQ